MDEDTDFSALYRALGVGPDCSPERLRQAYRRTVARLHPDQRGQDGDLSRLQELNRLYGAAMAFLREHGRLPGVLRDAAQAGVPTPSPPGHAASAAPPAERRDRSQAGGDGAAGTGALSRWFVWLAMAAVAVLVLRALGQAWRADPDTAAVHAHADPARRTHADEGILLGMGQARVQAIQGMPAGREGDRWRYGPSWIEFGCGGVVTDWYSAPARPLRVHGAHPLPRDRDRFERLRPPGC